MKSKNFTSFFSRQFLQAVVLSTIFSCFTLSANSATATITGAAGVTWTGAAGDGLWSTAGNWSSNAVPVATDSVFITSPNAVTISTAVGTIDKLTVQGSLTITSSGSLTITQAVKSTAILEIGGGVVTNAGSLSLTQTAAFSNPGLNFVNGTAANGTLTNTGTLSINTGFTGSTGACVNFNQTTGGTADFEMGSSGVTLTQASGKNVFNMNAGAAQIGGTLTLGSISSYPNFKLINVAAGSLTLLNTANITAYVTVTTSNIALGGSTANQTTTLTNNGSLNIHLAASGNTNNVILINPTVANATAILSNSGTITIDGTNSTGSVGSIGFNGFDATSNSTLNNTGTITDTHSGTTASIYCFSSTTIKIYTINNSGIMSFPTGMTLGCSTTINNNNGGIVNMRASMTGATGTGAPGSIINNNVGGLFNFDVATLTTTVTNTLSFKNYGKIIGRGAFLTGTFVPQSGGIIAPGNTNNTTGTAGTNAGVMVPTGQFTLNGTPMDFSNNTFVIKVNGTTAGTSYDQVLNGTASAALNLTGAVFNITVGGGYSPVTNDVVKPFSAASTATISGTLGSSTVPANWTLTTGASAISATYSVSTGVENLKSSSLISFVDGNIQFTANGNQPVEIFNAVGQRLVSKLSVNGLNSIQLSTRGLVIVKVGNFSQKIVL